MNTTDRSVGSIDYAVRRRFAFYTLAARKKVLEEYYKKEDALRSEAIARFEKVWNFLNAKDNRSNDMEFEDLMVGHSYFIAETLDELNLKWKYEVIPLLKEYQKDGLLRHSIDIEKDLNVEIQEAEV
jgi:5-methylcytosine-specific restriction protein B